MTDDEIRALSNRDLGEAFLDCRDPELTRRLHAEGLRRADRVLAGLPEAQARRSNDDVTGPFDRCLNGDRAWHPCDPGPFVTAEPDATTLLKRIADSLEQLHRSFFATCGNCQPVAVGVLDENLHSDFLVDPAANPPDATLGPFSPK